MAVQHSISLELKSHFDLLKLNTLNYDTEYQMGYRVY